MKKQIDISKYEDFIEAGFKECEGCGWAFSPGEFDRHNCDDMNKDTGFELPTPNEPETNKKPSEEG